MRVITRRGLAGLAFSVAVAASSVLASSPASADPVSVTCPLGSSTVSYDPPLTNTTQMTHITVHRELGLCTVSPQPHPDDPITTGTVDWEGTFPASCTIPLVANGLTSVIVWNTGETSTLSLNAVSTIVAGVLHTFFNGSVTSGLFQGSTVVWDQVAVPNPLGCLTTGVPTQFATLTTQITSTA